MASYIMQRTVFSISERCVLKGEFYICKRIYESSEALLSRIYIFSRDNTICDPHSHIIRDASKESDGGTVLGDGIPQRHSTHLLAGELTT